MVDAALLLLLLRHLEDVLLDGVRAGIFFGDALQAGGEHGGESDVGVAGGAGGAVLDAGGVLLAGLVLRHADEVGAVAARPGEVTGRFEAWDETTVGVEP